MKTYLLIAAAVVIQPVALLGQTVTAAAGYQQAQELGTIQSDRRPGDVVVMPLQPAMAGGRGGAPMIGKPYSATAVTHTVQVLGDGSQIERTQSQVVYRDEQGRTRNETNEGRFIRIVDRVAGVSYNLDTAAKIARTTEMMIAGRGISVAAATQDMEKLVAQVKQEAEISGDQSKRTVGAAGGIGVVPEWERKNFITDDLGTQFVNGVQAKGVRTTSTIPVGAIGNNRELKTVSERWESKDLGILIKSVNSDPRFGTTTYELTNISQSAPDPSLFRVPADYTMIPPPKRN